ncbi:MAG: allantoinase AllB [Chitinophagaceae bacterium]
MKSAIHSTRIISEGTLKNATIIITDGIITEILDGLVQLPAMPFVEAGDNVVMAGVIDPHVHINEPGRTEWEGFDTATRAAIAGGVTSLVEMPLNASPVTVTAAAFDEKIQAAHNKLHTNCGFWGGLIPGNVKDIEPMAAKGVLGFKAFLTHSGIDEFPNVTEADLHKAMPIIARLGLPLLVHCELTTPHDKETMANKRSYHDYLISRPRSWEDEAIAMMIRLCEQYMCRTHIVHLSSSGSVEQIKNAKQKGLPITVETAQHYLYFAAENIKDGQTAFKCAPPIREQENNELLWDALKSGVIDFAATDHSPATPALKELQTGDFSKAWGGIASIQFALPALWTAAKKRNAGITDMAMWLCEKPARLMGNENNKGKIARGYTADLVVWNPEQSFTVTESIIQHRHKITPYLNEQLYGTVAQTWLQGVKVFDNGTFTRLNQGKIILK